MLSFSAEAMNQWGKPNLVFPLQFIFIYHHPGAMQYVLQAITLPQPLSSLASFLCNVALGQIQSKRSYCHLIRNDCWHGDIS
jgi:hypothetical protein